MGSSKALIVGCAAFTVCVAAHAAPGAPVGTAPAPVAPANAMLRVETTVNTMDPQKCGEKPRAHMLLSNKTLRDWMGWADFTTGGGPSAQQVISLTARGDGSTKVVELPAQVTLDCKAPLRTMSVSVLESVPPNQRRSLFQRYLRPKAVSGWKSEPMGAPGHLFVRRVALNGKCGEGITPSATLDVAGGAPPPPNSKATVKLVYAGLVKEATITWPASEVKFDAPVPLDCSAAGGIPALDYSVTIGATTASGKVDVVEVTFE